VALTHGLLLAIAILSHLAFIVTILFVKLMTVAVWCLEWLVRRCTCPKNDRVAPPAEETPDLSTAGLQNPPIQRGLDDLHDDDMLAGEHEEEEDDSDGDYNETAGLLTRVLGRLTISDRQVAASVSEPSLDPHSDSYFSDLLDRALRQAPRMRFCYLKCLDPVDQITFKDTMVRLIKRNYTDLEMQKRIILQGCMRMGTWRTIMQRIPLACKYKLWRSAYWGENAGRTQLSTATSRYHVLVDEFGPKNSILAINLVHTEGHIEELPWALIVPADKFNQAASQNLWDEMSC
jgi:hypothetical protein